MLQSSKAAHKLLCCTIPNTFQSLLLVFLLRKGLWFFTCRNDSDVSADISRELAALCPPGEPAPDVAPGFQQKSWGFSLRSSQPAPLTFSRSDPGWVKPGGDWCFGKGGTSCSHTDACAATRAGLAAMQERGTAGEGRAGGLQPAAVPATSTCQAMAVICSFPLISLRTFWIIPLLLFQCSISCECWRVLNKAKDNRPLMHPSSRWLDRLPLPADLCGYLSACCFSLPVIYTALASFPST